MDSVVLIFDSLLILFQNGMIVSRCLKEQRDGQVTAYFLPRQLTSIIVTVYQVSLNARNTFSAFTSVLSSVVLPSRCLSNNLKCVFISLNGVYLILKCSLSEICCQKAKCAALYASQPFCSLIDKAFKMCS